MSESKSTKLSTFNHSNSSNHYFFLVLKEQNEINVCGQTMSEGNANNQRQYQNLCLFIQDLWAQN